MKKDRKSQNQPPKKEKKKQQKKWLEFVFVTCRISSL